MGSVGHVPALTTRDATPDDFDALIEVRARSFGLMSSSEREEWKVSAAGAVQRRC